MSFEKHHYLIWKINSHSIQVIVVLRQSEHKLKIEIFSLIMQAKKIVGGLIPFDVGTSLKSQFQLLEHLICSATFQNVFGASILNHLTLLNYHVVIKTCMSDVRNIHRRRSRFSTLSGALRT